MRSLRPTGLVEGDRDMKATAKRVLATVTGRKRKASETPAPSLADAVTSERVKLTPQVHELYVMIDHASGAAVQGRDALARAHALLGLRTLMHRSPAQANKFAEVMGRGYRSQAEAVSELVAYGREIHGTR